MHEQWYRFLSLHENSLKYYEMHYANEMYIIAPTVNNPELHH